MLPGLFRGRPHPKSICAFFLCGPCCRHRMAGFNITTDMGDDIQRLSAIAELRDEIAGLKYKVDALEAA